MLLASMTAGGSVVLATTTRTTRTHAKGQVAICLPCVSHGFHARQAPLRSVGSGCGGRAGRGASRARGARAFGSGSGTLAVHLLVVVKDERHRVRCILSCLRSLSCPVVPIPKRSSRVTSRCSRKCATTQKRFVCIRTQHGGGGRHALRGSSAACGPFSVRRRSTKHHSRAGPRRRSRTP